jgi:hypothetical protein
MHRAADALTRIAYDESISRLYVPTETTNPRMEGKWKRLSGPSPTKALRNASEYSRSLSEKPIPNPKREEFADYTPTYDPEII